MVWLLIEDIHLTFGAALGSIDKGQNSRGVFFAIHLTRRSAQSNHWVIGTIARPLFIAGDV